MKKPKKRLIAPRAKKPAPPKRQAKAKQAKAATPKPKRTTARSVPLPGMEQITNRILNNACEQIAEGRSFMARGRTVEQEGIGIALQEMQRRDVRAYRHAGVELAFVPGVDKLRVRLTEDSQNATGESRRQQSTPAAPEADTVDEPDAADNVAGLDTFDQGDEETFH